MLPKGHSFSPFPHTYYIISLYKLSCTCIACQIPGRHCYIGSSSESTGVCEAVVRKFRYTSLVDTHDTLEIPRVVLDSITNPGSTTLWLNHAKRLNQN